MIKVFFTLATALVLLSGCGDDTPNLNEIVTLANGKITRIADIIQTDDTRRSSRAGINDVWTDAGGVNALSNLGTETLADWIGHMFDENFENSNGARVTFAGRIHNELQILCFITNAGLPTDGTGLPTDGSHTLTLSDALAATCGEAGQASGDVTLTVATLSDTTIYTKSITATLAGAAASCPFKFLVKNDGTELNLAGAEDQNCDGNNQASGSVFRYNAASQITRLTYVSENFDPGSQGFEFYRGTLNEATDEAHVLGIYGGQSAPDTLANYVAFTAAGRPTAGGTVALSVQVNDQPAIADGDYDGCINSSTGAVDADNTLACTLTGTAIGTAFPIITAEMGSNTAIASIYNIGATTDVGFTSASDIYTATRR